MPCDHHHERQRQAPSLAERAKAYAHGSALAACLDQPNPWSAWMGSDEPAWGSLRFAALMLRDVSVPTMIDLLAPNLERERLLFEGQLTFMIGERGLLRHDEPLTFNRWLVIQYERLTDPFTLAMRATLGQFTAPLDARLFAETIVDDPTFEPLALLDMLVKSITFWNEGQDETEQVSPENRWLIELEPAAKQEGLALLYGHFYNLFRASGIHPCERLPFEYEVFSGDEKSLYLDKDGANGALDRTAEELKERLTTIRKVEGRVLGSRSHHWPARAAALVERLKPSRQQTDGHEQ